MFIKNDFTYDYATYILITRQSTLIRCVDIMPSNSLLCTIYNNFHQSCIGSGIPLTTQLDVFNQWYRTIRT